MLQVGDTVAIIPGMVRCAVMREVGDPLEDLGIHVDIQKVDGEERRVFHRITAFAYVGCHDRGDFEKREKEGLGAGWQEHCCLKRDLQRWHII
jgi:aminoglycoside phosphotransferase (APT) family kinase protein